MAEHGDLQPVLLLHDVEQLLQRDVRPIKLEAIPRRPLPFLPQKVKTIYFRMIMSI